MSGAADTIFSILGCRSSRIFCKFSIGCLRLVAKWLKAAQSRNIVSIWSSSSSRASENRISCPPKFSAVIRFGLLCGKHHLVDQCNERTTQMLHRVFPNGDLHQRLKVCRHHECLALASIPAFENGYVHISSQNIELVRFLTSLPNDLLDQRFGLTF